MFEKMEWRLWEYSAGTKYRGFTIAKTELTAKKNAITATGVTWLNFAVKAIETPGFKLIPRKDEQNGGTDADGG